MAFSAVGLAQSFGGNVSLVNRDQFILNWEVAIPTNSGYLNKTSFANGRAEYRHLFSDQFGLGLSLGWNSFEQRVGQQLYETPDGSSAVFTDLIRQVYKLPISLNGYYYFGSSDTFRPYVGLGLGANYSEQEAYFNIFVIRDRNWGFLARPELGMQYFFNSDVGIIFYANYAYATNSSEFFDISNLTQIGLGLGLTWSW